MKIFLLALTLVFVTLPATAGEYPLLERVAATRAVKAGLVVPVELAAEAAHEALQKQRALEQRLKELREFHGLLKGSPIESEAITAAKAAVWTEVQTARDELISGKLNSHKLAATRDELASQFEAAKAAYDAALAAAEREYGRQIVAQLLPLVEQLAAAERRQQESESALLALQTEAAESCRRNQAGGTPLQVCEGDAHVAALAATAETEVAENGN